MPADRGLSPLLGVVFVVAFGAQTDEVCVNKPKFGEKFHRFYVMHMRGFHPPSVPFALPAEVSVTAQDLNTLSMLRIIPPRIVIVKLHRQNKRGHDRNDKSSQSWPHGL